MDVSERVLRGKRFARRYKHCLGGIIQINLGGSMIGLGGGMGSDPLSFAGETLGMSRWRTGGRYLRRSGTKSSMARPIRQLSALMSREISPAGIVVPPVSLDGLRKKCLGKRWLAFSLTAQRS